MAAIASIDPTIDWLLKSSEPVIRYRAIVDLLELPADDHRSTYLSREIADGPIVSALMSGLEANGGFGRHPYSKWTGGHWRLVSLMDLGAPSDLDGARAAIERVFRWLAHFRAPGASSSADVVDWGIGQPSEPVALGAILVLKAAGRMSSSTGQRNQAHAWTVAAP